MIIFSLKRFDVMRGFRAGCACEGRELYYRYLAERHLRAEERFKVYLSPQCFSSIFSERHCSVCCHGKNFSSCESWAGVGPGHLCRAACAAPHPMQPASLCCQPQLQVPQPHLITCEYSFPG